MPYPAGVRSPLAALRHTVDPVNAVLLSSIRVWYAGVAGRRGGPGRGIHEIRTLLEPNVAGTTLFLSSHLPAEVEQVCARRGDGPGRLVMQEDLATLRAPTGRIVLGTADADRVVGVLDGRVEARTGDRLVIRYTDAAELNERLVREGVRIAELAPERATLEDVVLAVTSTGSDRMDTP